MDDNRYRSSTTDNNEQTRHIPTPNARQIPVQRNIPTNGTRAVRPAPAAQPVQNGSDTRQIPVQRNIPTNGTRAVRPAPAAQPVQNSSDTRQIPVQRNIPADGTRAVRPSPAAQPVQNGSDTRQIPVSANSSTTSVTPVMQKNVQINPAKPMDLASTRQVSTASIDRVNNTSGNGSDTKIMNTSTEESIPESKKKRRSKEKDSDKDNGNTIVSIVKAIVYIVAVLIISVTASLFIILVGNDMFAFVKSDEVVTVTIPKDADVGDIASILSDSGVIKYPGIFEWYAEHNDDDGKFNSGTYSIACNLDYEDLLASFKDPVIKGTSWVTIPEGFTTDEIIDLLVETGIGTKEGYIDAINNYPFDYWFVEELDKSDWKESGRIYRLDGYLFPDTYEFYNDSSEKTVINKLLARFNVIYGKKYREAAETMGISVDDIVIIASMIEKEAGKAADYHLVSSVFHNRLASPYYPKLESDATALYAIHHDTGERPTDVTGEHMKYDTPYNTYLYEGLPPGPIANPSASAINAALTPENTNYYYFVSYATNTYFGRNNDEHEANKRMIAEMKEKANGNVQ